MANATTCFVMETEVVIFLVGPVDEDVAAYEGYSAIESSMSNSSYVRSIPTVVGLEFLSPLPLPGPPDEQGGNGTATPIVSETNTSNRSSVNPWTIGACFATIMGGALSMLMWSRSRRFRQSRQQLMDEAESVNANGSNQRSNN